MDYHIMPKKSIRRSAGDVKHTCEMQERKAANAEFLNLLGQIDSEIHLTIILQEVGKELRMFNS